MIEVKNGELKNQHGYDVAISSGLFGMRIQGAIAIFNANIKRIDKKITHFSNIYIKLLV